MRRKHRAAALLAADRGLSGPNGDGGGGVPADEVSEMVQVVDPDPPDAADGRLRAVADNEGDGFVPARLPHFR